MSTIGRGEGEKVDNKQVVSRVNRKQWTNANPGLQSILWRGTKSLGGIVLRSLAQTEQV